MKLGLISDIHGDPVALELAWSYLTVMGADKIVCAGDLVGYGPLPDRVISFLQERSVEAVRGNHDRWALERGSGVRDEYGTATPSDDTLEFLSNLPLFLVVSDGPKQVVVVHGSPRSDMEFLNAGPASRTMLRAFLSELNCDVLVSGHTHVPMWFRSREGIVVNPGSVVSMPVVDSSRTFAMLDVDALEVTFHDVEHGELVAIESWE
jgi:putative phosphoesterase